MQVRKEMINMQNAKLAYTVEEASKSTGRKEYFKKSN